MSREELQKKRRRLKDSSDAVLRNMNKITEECYRVADVAHNSHQVLDDLEREFEQVTSLQGNDIKFLFVAVGLQLLRITIINELTKVEPAGKHNQIEKKLHKAQEKLLSKFDVQSDIDSLYYASMKHIVSKTGVPYDAQETLTVESVHKLVNKSLSWPFDAIEPYLSEDKIKLFKGANHRFSTLGHDPIIGLVFGTANIMTNTISTVNRSTGIPIIASNHVIYTSNYSHPRIVALPPASTSIMLYKVADRIKDEPNAFIAALIKQIIHIGTDMFTPCGIQIPGANLLLSNSNVERITRQIGFGDLVKIGVSAKIAELINIIISALHTLTHNNKDGVSSELYNVRTRKIILYSNAIATGSNAIWVGANVVVGDKSQLKNLDIGGLMVLLKHLLTDEEYIRKIKEEFVLGGFKKMIQGNDLEMEEVKWG